MRRTLAAAVLLLAACSDGGGGGGGGGASRPNPEELAGEWEVTMVIGTVDADDDIVPSLLPDRDADYRETWRFESCDDTGCTLRRPDGGLLLGDLDNVRFAFADDLANDLGVTTDAAEPGNDGGTPGPCEGQGTDEWTVTIQLGVHDSVLSGSVLRQAVEHRVAVDEDTTCFGVSLSLGLSGVPLADGGA